MKLLYTFFLFLFTLTINLTFGQVPVVGIWDKKYGGDQSDFLTAGIEKTSDGGIVLAGSSLSWISGNKSQNGKGNYDYWIVKIDYDGHILWQKDYGGNDDDMLFSIQETSDKGFILGGTSKSGVGGDKTQSCVDTSTTLGRTGDYWIIKIDSLGNIEWDKTFGGFNQETFSSVYSTSDHGYILGGTSYSGIGGDKTQPLNDPAQALTRCDYWIIKLDSAGNKIWDKDYGGLAPDELGSTVQTADGGFLLAGMSSSGIGGDKTQLNFGYEDIWILKTDSSGTIMWDKDFGGTYSEYFPKLFSDSGQFIIGCTSNSSMTGNKNTATWAQSQDYWIFKIDSIGNKLWEADFGGTDFEDFHSIRRTNDGGYILSGDSYSTFAGGDKSDINFHSEQTWIIKIDSLRNKEWDRTLQTYGITDDEDGVAIQTNDGCYFIANSSPSYPGGDDTQLNWDPTNTSHDFWLIKMCDSSFLLPTAYFMSSNYICPGACVFFQNLSEHATYYEWSFPGANPGSSTDANPQNICYSTPGIYDVQLIAGNANSADTFLLSNYMTVFNAPLPQSITQSNDTLYAIAGASSYQWYYNGAVIAGATNYFYVAIQSGDYNVVATDDHNCEVEAVINDVVASSQFAPDSYQDGSLQFAIVPNPVTEMLYIRGLKNNSAEEISIYNVVGEKVFSAVDWNPDGYREPIANCQFSPGLYYIEVTSGKKIYRAKFVKQ